jgi:hypothetical protein
MIEFILDHPVLSAACALWLLIAVVKLVELFAKEMTE